MKIKITKPDGTVIDAEGTPDELARVMGIEPSVPIYKFVPYVPYVPAPTWPTWPYTTTWSTASGNSNSIRLE